MYSWFLIPEFMTKYGFEYSVSFAFCGADGDRIRLVLAEKIDSAGLVGVAPTFLCRALHWRVLLRDFLYVSYHTRGGLDAVFFFLRTTPLPLQPCLGCAFGWHSWRLRLCVAEQGVTITDGQQLVVVVVVVVKREGAAWRPGGLAGEQRPGVSVRPSR